MLKERVSMSATKVLLSVREGGTWVTVALHLFVVHWRLHYDHIWLRPIICPLAWNTQTSFPPSLPILGQVKLLQMVELALQ